MYSFPVIVNCKLRMRSKGLTLKMAFLTFESSENCKESEYLQNIKIIESLQRLDSK